MRLRLPFGIVIQKIEPGIISERSIWTATSHGGGYFYAREYCSFLGVLWLVIREYGQDQHLAM